MASPFFSLKLLSLLPPKGDWAPHFWYVHTQLHHIVLAPVVLFNSYVQKQAVGAVIDIHYGVYLHRRGLTLNV